MVLSNQWHSVRIALTSFVRQSLGTRGIFCLFDGIFNRTPEILSVAEVARQFVCANFEICFRGTDAFDPKCLAVRNVSGAVRGMATAR